jgi:hypothetical protein
MTLCAGCLDPGVSCRDLSPREAPGILHHQAASAALLWRIGVLALWHNTPDGRHHVVSGAIAVGNDASDANR